MGQITENSEQHTKNCRKK